jgi:acetyl esterase
MDADTVPPIIRASPVTYGTREMPAFLLIHGSKDQDVPYEQSIAMCEKMRQAGAHCDLITIDGAPHGMDHREGHPEFLWYKKAIVDWLQKIPQ